MRIVSSLVVLLLTTSAFVHADERGKLIFQDDFNRNESQEVKDEVGNGWRTNSKARAGGNKQVDLRDGAMHMSTHKTADHAVSIVHEAEFTDGTVEVRMMLEKDKDTLGLNFADLQLKTVHAGHLFRVTVGTTRLEIADLKTGNMKLDFYEARKAKRLTPEMRKTLATKSKVFPLKLKTGQWYTLDVRVVGEELRVKIDGKEVGRFASEGIAHPTKRLLRFAVPKQAVVDDLKIYTAK